MREADRRRHLARAGRIWTCRVQIECSAPSKTARIPLLVWVSRRYVTARETAGDRIEMSLSMFTFWPAAERRFIIIPSRRWVDHAHRVQFTSGFESNKSLVEASLDVERSHAKPSAGHTTQNGSAPHGTDAARHSAESPGSAGHECHLGDRRM